MIAPARRVAYSVVRRVFEDESYADRAFRTLAADLDDRDRALAQRLALGLGGLGIAIARLSSGLCPAALAFGANIITRQCDRFFSTLSRLFKRYFNRYLKVTASTLF